MVIAARGLGVPGCVGIATPLPAVMHLRLLLVALLVLPCFAASPALAEAPANPIILIGVDGMEWSVIDDLSAKGQLPNITKLRKKAATARLATDYGAASPVVWTTIATGMNNDVHGITGFEVGTDDGSAPVSSSMRKVAAVWNMATVGKKRVMALGWWGSWPAEAVNGRVVTDRSHTAIDHRVYPAEWEPTFVADLKKASTTDYPSGDDAGGQDRMVEHFLLAGLADKYDLMCAYLHGTDLVSHKYWKYYRPDGFPALDAAKTAKYADMIPSKYRAVDSVIGKVVASMSPNTNLFVVSDHGFGPLPVEFVKVSLAMDELLARVGLEVRASGKVDFAKSKVYAYGSAAFQMRKFVRYSLAGRDAGGVVTAATMAATRAEVERVLAEVTYLDGSPAFAVRDAVPADVRKGADFIVEVQTRNPTTELKFRGETITGMVKAIVEHSGGHSGTPPGVFMASGPDIDPKADLTGIRIHDITPTLLFGAGLPVAKDFAGKPWQGLFVPAFRAAHPLQTIATWGKGGSGDATKSAETDEEMLEQLRALGYIQ